MYLDGVGETIRRRRHFLKVSVKVTEMSPFAHRERVSNSLVATIVVVNGRLVLDQPPFLSQMGKAFTWEVYVHLLVPTRMTSHVPDPPFLDVHSCLAAFFRPRIFLSIPFSRVRVSDPIQPTVYHPVNPTVIGTVR